MRAAPIPVAVAIILAGLQPAPAHAAAEVFGTTSLVSVAVDGAPGDDDSCCSAVSDDGRIVAFTSSARDLVAGEPTWRMNVYVRDMALGTTERVSLQPDGRPFEWHARLLSMSADGGLVYFLVQRRYSDVYRVWVRDRARGASTLLRKAATEAAVSANGRWLAFATANDTVTTLRLRNLDTGEDRIVASLPDPYGVGPSVADTGDVAFHTEAPLEPADTDADHDPYVWTRAADAFRVLPQDEAGGHPLTAGLPTITPDGAAAVFWADGWILWDRASDTSTFIDDASYNEFVPLTAAITPDARYVVYAKGEADEHGSTSLLLFDAQAGTTERVDVNEYGWASRGDTRPMFPAISPDGRFVTFTSDAPSLVPSFTGTAYLDVYVRDRSGTPTPGPLPNVMIRTHDQPFRTGRDQIGIRVDGTWVSVAPGSTETVRIFVRNESPFGGDVAIGGSGSSPRVRVRYFVGDANVTREVVAGTFTSTLDTGAALPVRLRVHVPRDAPRIDRALTIRAWSVPVPAWRDVMGLGVQIW